MKINDIRHSRIHDRCRLAAFRDGKIDAKYDQVLLFMHVFLVPQNHRALLILSEYLALFLVT